MILGRIEVRDRDLGCVILAVLTPRSCQESWVKIPAFQPFGYLTDSVPAVFARLRRFPHPELPGWGGILRWWESRINRARPTVELPTLELPTSCRFGDPKTSFEGCDGTV